MDPRDFLDLAAELATGVGEAEWRTSTSRGYYAAFHVARSLLERAGFSVPDAQQCHTYVSRRLSNAGNSVVSDAGRRLGALRSDRNWADYGLGHEFPEEFAHQRLNDALDIIKTLDDLAAAPDLLAEVIAAVRAYERDVLKEVTHRAP